MLCLRHTNHLMLGDGMKAKTVLLLISVTGTVSGARAQDLEASASDTSAVTIVHPILSADLTTLRTSRPELTSAADQFAELHIFETPPYS